MDELHLSAHSVGVGELVIVHLVCEFLDQGWYFASFMIRP